MRGKGKKFPDALLAERLVEDKLLPVAEAKNRTLVARLVNDFGMGAGEAESLALAMTNGYDVIATDNRQGRKAAFVNCINLVGSPEIVMALFNT